MVYPFLHNLRSYKLFKMQNTRDLFIKNHVFILICLNFSHLQSTLHWIQYIYWDIFFHCSKQSLNSLILMLFSASAFFVCLFYLSHMGKTFLFENFFHLNKQQQKVIWGEIRWIGRVRHCWTLSVVWAGELINHPSWHGQTCWKSVQKNSLKTDRASHSNANWYTDTDGFLEHAPSLVL